MANMHKLPAVLFAAIDTGMWSVEEAKAWAASLTIEGLLRPLWVDALAIATTSEELASIVRDAMREHGFMLPANIAELLAGLLYLRFQHGDISREELDRNLGDVLDAYEASFLSVEAWSEQASGGSLVPDETARLEQLARYAADELERLRSARRLEPDSFFR